MYKPIILPDAKADIKLAALWYNEQKPGLGRRFTVEVRHKVHYLCRNPKASVVRYSKVRTAVLNVFPYIIHLVIDEKNGTVLILAVLHTSRRPRY